MLSSNKDTQFWEQFLPQVNKAIEGALASVIAGEEALSSMGQTTAGNFDARLVEMGTKISNCANRPEESIAAADLLLEKTEEEYRGKLAGIEALRQKLAEWVRRQETNSKGEPGA